MATIGLSKPYCAKYNFDDKTKAVSYTEGMVMGKATEMDISISTSDDNNLYADNGIAESDRTFADGTLTLSTDDLTQEVSAMILGAVQEDIGTIAGITDTGVKELLFDDDQQVPYLGVGFIVKKKHRGLYKWRAVILSRVMFNVPADAATTQGESIEWQVPTLTATILRDETDKHSWKREATFTTEAQAEIYIKNRLGIA